jgi:pimeloyl-ACP methyl ester carboxylesterase
VSAGTGTEVARSGEQMAEVGELKLAYETFGDRGDPAMLMVMGLGSQMIFWPDRMCEMLAEQGFFVIRFDNRDAGRSTKLDEAGVPSLTRVLGGDRSEAPYTLDDMADDAAGLLDELGIEKAHVVGASQGGMIAQTLAVRHPDKVISLASIMSSTGNREVGQPHPEGLQALMWRPRDDAAGYADDFVAARRLIASSGFEVDEEATRELAARAFERGRSVDGTMRQLTAILAAGNRTEDLRKLDLPTVVIHGEIDPLIDVSGGKATAEAIAGSKLVLIPGLGHDLPRGVWQQMVDEIVANARRGKSRKAQA